MAIAPDLDEQVRNTCSATIGNATKVTVPLGADTALLRPIGNKGKVCYTGTDAAAIPATYSTLDADVWTPWPCAAQAFLYVAHDSASGVVEILFPAVP